MCPFQRSSWGLPVRADSRAASRISITCTLSNAETGSSIGLLLRMQSTKYVIGLLVSLGSGSSARLSPSGGTFGPCASAARCSKLVWRASKLPFGPNTSTWSLVYGQFQEASIIAVASGYSSTIVASSSTLLFFSSFYLRVVAYTRVGRPFSHSYSSAPEQP